MDRKSIQTNEARKLAKDIYIAMVTNPERFNHSNTLINIGQKTIDEVIDADVFESIERAKRFSVLINKFL